jgi:hypothetical protein
MTEGPRLSRPLLDHFELVEGEGRRPGGAAGATECGEVMSCTDEGALSFVTTRCYSYRDSPYKREWEVRITEYPRLPTAHELAGRGAHGVDVQRRRQAERAVLIVR